MGPGTPQTATSVIYVIGEVLISLAVLGIGAYLLAVAPTGQAQIVGGSIITGVTVFWFQRRSAEQSNNNLAMLADGKITQLLEQQAQIQSQQNNLLALSASAVRASNEATRTASEAALTSAHTAAVATDPTLGGVPG